MVPEVPKLMLHLPSPTVWVPTAAAALSPAPAHTRVLGDSPRAWATSSRRAPTRSQLSWRVGIWSSLRWHSSNISRLQVLCSTSSSSVPEASE